MLIGRKGDSFLDAGFWLEDGTYIPPRVPDAIDLLGDLAVDEKERASRVLRRMVSPINRAYVQDVVIQPWPDPVPPMDSPSS